MTYPVNSPPMQDDAIGSQRDPLAGPEPRQASLRLLLIAPDLPPLHLRGGMDIAVASVATELRQRGWIVEQPLITDASAAFHKPSEMRAPPLLNRVLRSRLRSFVRLPQFFKAISVCSSIEWRSASSTTIC